MSCSSLAGHYLGKAAPDMGDLDFLKDKRTGNTFRLTDKIGTQWRNIGSRLGMECDVLNATECDYHSTADRLRHMLGTWLSNARGLPNH